MTAETLFSEKGRVLTLDEVEELWRLAQVYFEEMNQFHRARETWMSDPQRDMNAFPEAPPFYCASLFYHTDEIRNSGTWEGTLYHVENVVQYRLDSKAFELYPKVVDWMHKHGFDLR